MMTADKAILLFREAGFAIGREERGLLWSAERDGRLVWLDVGYTVRVVGDDRDLDNEMFHEVVRVLG